MLSQLAEQRDYFHLLHQLIKNLGSDDELSRLNHKRLVIKPKPGLTFPARDVDAINEDCDHISLSCQFMGLYGVDSPLPLYFNQSCLGDSSSSQVMRDFLDIFNHRNYVLYFLAWRAFHPEFALESGDCGYLDFVAAMTGHLRHQYSLPLANTIGKSNTASLYTLINYFLPNSPVRIHESIEKWVSIDNIAVLGSQNLPILGDNSLLGEHIVDTTSSIQIDIGPVSWELSKQLMPGMPLANALWTKLCANLESQIDVYMNLLILVDKPQVVLGQSDTSLGYHTWLGDWNKQQPLVISLSSDCILKGIGAKSMSGQDKAYPPSA